MSVLCHDARVSEPADPLTQPDTEPYEGGSGPVGVLLVHGFTSTPQSMRPWANHLQAAGFRVSVPRLPGHGTTWEELNETAWTDWYEAADRAFGALADSCDQVFVCGLSMGATLCLRLAEQHGPAVSGIVAVNPVITHRDLRLKVLPLLKRLTPSLGAIANDIARPGVVETAYARTPLRALHSQLGLWAAVRRDLTRIDQPLLIFRSVHDRVVDATSVPKITLGVRSTDLEVISLERSYHVATLDYDDELIFDGSTAMFRRLAKD